MDQYIIIYNTKSGHQNKVVTEYFPRMELLMLSILGVIGSIELKKNGTKVEFEIKRLNDEEYMV